MVSKEINEVCVIFRQALKDIDVLPAYVINKLIFTNSIVMQLCPHYKSHKLQEQYNNNRDIWHKSNM